MHTKANGARQAVTTCRWTAAARQIDERARSAGSQALKFPRRVHPPERSGTGVVGILPQVAA